MTIDEQVVDWVEAQPGQQLKRAINESIKTHNQQGYELEYMKDVDTQGPSKSMLLLYEKD